MIKRSAAAVCFIAFMLLLCPRLYAAGPKVIILPFDTGTQGDWTGRGIAEIIEYMLNGGSQADSFRQLGEAVKADPSKLYGSEKELLIKTAAGRRASFIIAGFAAAAASGLKLELITYDMKSGKETKTLVSTTKDALAGDLQKFCEGYFTSNKINYNAKFKIDFTPAGLQNKVSGDDLFFRGGNDTGALSYYLKALQESPNYAEAYYMAGVAYFYQKDFVRSQENLEKAVELRPDNSKYHFSLGVTYRYAGFLYKGIQEYKKAVYYDPDFALGYYNLANVYRDQNSNGPAEENYTQALNINSELWPAYSNLAEIYLRGKKYTEVLELMKDFTGKPDKVPSAMYYMGMAYAGLENEDSAVYYFDRHKAINGSEDRILIDSVLKKLRDNRKK